MHTKTVQRSIVYRWGLSIAALLVVSAPAALGQETSQPPAPRLSLQDLVNLGFEKQPALAAARASLAAAESGQSGVTNLPPFAGLFSRDLPVRRKQACLGITIAAAGLTQAEWETRYAVVRNYYSIIYARQQLDLVLGIRRDVGEAIDQANALLKKGVLDLKITTIDRDILMLNSEIVKTKEIEARVGVAKAFAALREALGVGLEFPLEVAESKLPESFRVFSPTEKQDLIAQALSARGEMIQVQTANQVTELEISAQSRLWFKPTTKTFASAADLHAHPIPQGVANGEYRPGAIGPEMPNYFVGPRADRIRRAQDLNNRASAVVDKTHNLITLEVDATFLKIEEAVVKSQALASARKLAKDVAKRVRTRFNDGQATAGDLLQAQTLQNLIEAQYNETAYTYMLGLTALERVTAGRFRLTNP